MIISKSKISYIILELILWSCTHIFVQMCDVSYTDKSFRQLALYAVFMVVILLVVQFKREGGLLKPFSIVFLCFVLFQLGMPLLYGIDGGYTEWNIEFIAHKNKIDGLIYSLYCTHAFGVGACIGTSEEKKESNRQITFLQDELLVRKIAIIVGTCTGVIAIPLSVIILIYSIRYGYSYVKIDSMRFNNGVTNAARTLYPASLFLLIAYKKNNRDINIALLFLIMYGAITIAAGGRTTGISIALVLLYYYAETFEEQKGGKKFIGLIAVIVASIMIVSVSVAIKNLRMSQGEYSGGIISSIESLIEEMGFNFTSIAFTEMYVPNSVNYKYGLTYLCAIACLIPNSLDFVGFVKYCKSIAGESWLTNQLHTTYGSTFDYGVGFSIIAESYLNFGNLGWIAVLFQGIIIKKVLSIVYSKDDKFGNYIKMTMLWALTTYPRRSFFTLVKAIEYNVLLIIFIIWVAYKLKGRRSINR